MAIRKSMPRPKTKAAIPNRVPLPKAGGLVKPTPEQLVAQKEAIMTAGKAGTIADATAHAKALDLHPAVAAKQANLATAEKVLKGVQAAASTLPPAEDPDFTLDDPFRTLSDLADAVKFAVDMWKLSAKLQNLRINGPSAIGTPGCLDGPSLAPHIRTAPAVASWTDAEADIRDAVADGAASCFGQWQDQVTVPGLPWYPAFAAWPGPMAPPTPNVPTPLLALVSAKVSMIMVPGNLKSAMYEALPDSLQEPRVEQVMEGLSTVLAMAFTTWLPSAQVMLVMGKGPVPSFAPPYVPVGPVVAGDNIAAPGHLAAAPSLSPVPILGQPALQQ
jgi:hypothetical protein